MFHVGTSTLITQDLLRFCIDMSKEVPVKGIKAFPKSAELILASVLGRCEKLMYLQDDQLVGLNKCSCW